MRCEPKDPERNVALDRKEARLVGAGKRQRRVKVMRELPKPLGKVIGAGGNTGLQEGWVSRPTIVDESGEPMDRGGEDAIREINRQANELLVEQLSMQMKEMFTGLTLKQEEDTRRLREENLAIKKQMMELEKEKMQQNNRMEQLMAALVRQMGGDQLIPMQPTSER